MRTLTLSLAGLSLALLSAPAWAQQPVPPRPAAVQQPALLQPPKAPPPSMVAPSRTPAIQRAPVFAPVRAATKSGLPPDSVKPASRPAAAPSAAQARFVGRVTPPTTAPGASAAGLQRASLTATPVTVANAPAGATMQCRDGTWLTGTPSASRCSANGGVATILVPARPAVAPPAKPRQP